MHKEKVISTQKANSKDHKLNGAKNENSNKKVSLLNKKDDSEEYDLVPPDGGWGWLVLFGSCLTNILIPGTIKSFGVLFVEFVEEFNATPTKASWIPAICYFLYSSLGPVSSILSVKYSYRTVTLLGGASASLGMILSFWASSVEYLYISYGVLVGIGAGLSFPPTVYIVTSYFVKLRGLANGLCISGSALGSIILPPLLRWLLETYGYHGSCLIMGGITLNVFVAALFYEPVEQHMVRVPRARQALDDIPEEEDIGIVMKFENVDETATNHEQSDKQLLPYNSPPSPLYLPDDDKQQFVRSASEAVVQSYAKPGDEFQPRTRKISTPVRLPQRNQTFTPGQLNSQSSLYAVPEGRSSSKLTLRNLSRSRLSKRSPSTSSFLYISTPYHGSTLSFQPKEFSSHLSLRSVGSNGSAVDTTGQDKAQATDDTQGKTQSSQRSKFFDLSLLKDPMYLVILISNSTNAISYTNFIILLPSFGADRGFNKSLAAYLLSVVSATDLIGRIGGSALSDMGLIPKTWYFVGGLSISGLSLTLLPFASSYSTVCFWCALFGLASGIYVGITAVIMADMLGTERLTSSYGISLFINGILQLVGPPLCNYWYEAVDDYNPLFHALGLTLLAGASLWSFMPWIERRKAKAEEKLEAQIDEEAVDGY
ncbi:monocarboxylate transporter 13 [Drosophila pseudoobscura]|uniref:Monocarboxylate transporter 13 n=1 Tax=Drosophila pseudoobscura pseudoobscura TaxID=46245 RepID=A0A6I8VWW0_DROPS|nr:monocarboxylate transporter 13 [Drosophila pseudoobscura]XP_033235443.1 monocarboxylate transporter 13 [Drosophila pseudoobscura]XP_033235444.1 monocarboxylate transporter 13 [Drosophila pseudoobscura]